MCQRLKMSILENKGGRRRLISRRRKINEDDDDNEDGPDIRVIRFVLYVGYLRIVDVYPIKHISAEEN